MLVYYNIILYIDINSTNSTGRRCAGANNLHDAHVYVIASEMNIISNMYNL